jgi:hypothetical protein
MLQYCNISRKIAAFHSPNPCLIYYIHKYTEVPLNLRKINDKNEQFCIFYSHRKMIMNAKT